MIKGFLLRAQDGMQILVIDSSKTQCLIGFDKLFAALRDEQCLHKFLHLMQIKEIALLFPRAHLQNALVAVIARIAHRAHGNVDVWIALGEARIDHGLYHVFYL